MPFACRSVEESVRVLRFVAAVHLGLSGRLRPCPVGRSAAVVRLFGRGSCRLIPGPDDCVECWAGFARKMRYSREGPYRAASENFAQDRDRADRVDRIEMVAEKGQHRFHEFRTPCAGKRDLGQSVGFALHQGAQ